MANGPTRSKYVNALEDAIENIDTEKKIHTTNFFEFHINEDEAGAILDVYTLDGTLIDTVEYLTSSIVRDDDAGEA